MTTTTPTPRKGMTVSVLTGRSTNKVSYDTLTLVGEDVPEISTPTDDRPAVEIVPGNLPGTVKAVLVDGADSLAAFVTPAYGGSGSRTWPMMSGAWIYTSDSRFPYDHPVPLHNRYEVNPESDRVKLSLLLVDIHHTAIRRKHAALTTEIFDDRHARVTCEACGMSADALVKPLPNQIDIGGELVALNCSYERS